MESRKFLRRSTREQKKIPFVSLEVVSNPKKKGGLHLRYAHEVNFGLSWVED